MLIEPNNIYLGDCYKLIKDVPDKSIDLVYVDIPYLFADHGTSKTELGERVSKRELQFLGVHEKYKDAEQTYAESLRIRKNKIKNTIDYISLEDGIDYRIFDDYLRVLKKMNIFIWCSKMQILDILNYFSQYGNFDILCWCKTNPIPTSNNNWLPDIEYCLYFREKGVKLNQGYELKSKYYISSANVDDKKNYLHPTIKPLELVKRHILHTTDRGGVVLDTFMGSGTTCKACVETGRQYIGMEINEQYYNIAKDRLNNINAKGEVSLF